MERTADYEDAPGSPLHPEGDAEMRELPDLDETDLDFLELNPEIGKEVNNEVKPLDKQQQRRFITYVEEQQLQIQRKLVQSALNDEAYLSLAQAIQDISKLISFIWLSIGDEQKNSKVVLFGQTQLLLAVAVLPLDALLRVPLTQQETPVILGLFETLDDKFSRLIDGRIASSQKSSQTEKVRMGSIATQTRVLLQEEFTSKRIINYDFELSKVYEKVLERTGIFNE